MQSIQNLITQLEQSPQWQTQSQFRQLMGVWPRVVGAAVAQHSQPTNLQRGVLQVAVSSGAWAQTLMFERLKILQKLQQHLPPRVVITDLRFTPKGWSSGTGKPHDSFTTVLQQHPSWLPQRPPSAQKPATATAAFQQWATQMQTQLANQSVCPRCQCPCPTGELHRWAMCAICVSQQWQALLGNAQNR
jgi:predicted nucleic acid-binding Zn ribbon protein